MKIYGYGYGNAFSKRASGGASLPVNTVAPVVSGTAVAGQTLTATPGTWTGTPTPTVTGNWQRNGVNISGATALTYNVNNTTDVGQNITYEETASNSAGTVTADSNTLSIFLTLYDKYPMYNVWSQNMLLRGAHYGSAIIRLRRTNDSAESDFGVGTNGKLNESAITTWTGANSATLVTVYAQDGSTRHFTQSDPTQQPLFVNAGVIIKRTPSGSGAVAIPMADHGGTKSLVVSASTALYNFIHNGTTSFVAGVAEFGKVADPNAAYGLIGNYAFTSSNIGFALVYEDRAAVPANNAIRVNSANGLGVNTILAINSNTITHQQVCILTSQFDADNVTAADRSISRVNSSGELKGNSTISAPSASNATFNLQWGGTGNNNSRLVGYSSMMFIDNTDQSANVTNFIADLNSLIKAY